MSSASDFAIGFGKLIERYIDAQGLSRKEVAFRDLGPGASVGDLSAIDGRTRSATVVAVEPSTVLSMSGVATPCLRASSSMKLWVEKQWLML